MDIGLNQFLSPEASISSLETQISSETTVQDLEATRPRAILDIIQAASEFRFAAPPTDAPPLVPKECMRCGYMTSQVWKHVGKLSVSLCLYPFLAHTPSLQVLLIQDLKADILYHACRRKCARRARCWRG